MRNARSNLNGSLPLRTTALALLVGTSGLPISAAAQAPARVEAQPTTQCPENDLAASPIGARLRELGLRPGVTIDPATFMADPQVAEYVGKITQHQQLQKQRDWAGLCRYRAANAIQRLKPTPDVIFLGDSITENWIHADPGFFSDKVLDRGISGQTTSQILLRFYPDVVALRPKVVHIMAGTNDLMQDVGPVGDDDIVNNISAMLDIAAANRIEVVLASILPISVRPWRPTVRPTPRLLHLNRRLKELAASHRIGFVDYFAAMKDGENGLRGELGNDGVHPNRAGYAVMRPMAERAIRRGRK